MTSARACVQSTCEGIKSNKCTLSLFSRLRVEIITSNGRLSAVNALAGSYLNSDNCEMVHKWPNGFSSADIYWSSVDNWYLWLWQRWWWRRWRIRRQRIWFAVNGREMVLPKKCVTRFVRCSMCRHGNAYWTRSHLNAISLCENQSSIHISAVDCTVM